MKRLTIASAAAFSLLTMSLAAQDKTPDWQQQFAGLRWGSTLAEIKTAQPHIACVPSPKTEITQDPRPGVICTLPPTTGSLRLNRRVWVVGGRMTRAMVTFEQGDYKEIRQLLVEKYGPPTRSSSYLETWEGATVVATLDALTTSVPTVTLATRASVDSDEREMAAKNALTKEKF
jgi:hypothetical protein